MPLVWWICFICSASGRKFDRKPVHYYIIIYSSCTFDTVKCIINGVRAVLNVVSTTFRHQLHVSKPGSCPARPPSAEPFQWSSQDKELLQGTLVRGENTAYSFFSQWHFTLMGPEIPTGNPPTSLASSQSNSYLLSVVCVAHCW